MVLFIHNRYRVTGGEERAVEQLRAVVREQLGEPTELLVRDSATIGRLRAAGGLIMGGLDAAAVGDAVARSGARIVHAHNLQPTLGPRAIEAARAAGAAVVLHLHQYRLVCAVGVCFTRGAPCTRCHARNTWPGVRLRCRGGIAEALAYGAGIALWQRRMIDAADAFVVPSRHALQRLADLGIELPAGRAHVVRPPQRSFAQSSSAADGRYALVVARLSPEKGVKYAIEACRRAGVPLVVAGEGPERATLERMGARDAGAGRSSPPRFVGRVGDEELSRLRTGAALAIVPSLSENFPTVAAEAMAAGLPVAASRVGGMAELVEEDGLVEPGSAAALAEAIGRLWGDSEAGERNLARARAVCAPERVAADLASAYRSAAGHAAPGTGGAAPRGSPAASGGP